MWSILQNMKSLLKFARTTGPLLNAKEKFDVQYQLISKKINLVLQSFPKSGTEDKKLKH